MAQSSQEKLDTSEIVKVLIIGETGSGKSTFINYLTNYFHNGTLDNLKVAIPCEAHPVVTESFTHSEHEIGDSTKSKTDECHQYLFTGSEGCFAFLDTPGLSDTRGVEQDSINIKKITTAVEQLGGLTCVIIVVNGAACRLTLNLQNVIILLRGNLPDVVMDNVIVVLTNAKRHEATFKINALELHGNVYPYYFQNSAFCKNPSTWNSSVKSSLQQDWSNSIRELKHLIKTLKSFTVKSVSAFKEIQNLRNAIKERMHAARIEVCEIQKMQDEITMFETAIKQVQVDENKYKQYSKERLVDCVEIVDATYHSTLCQICNHVCHPKCQLDETVIAGSQIFTQCWCMDTFGKCKQCSNQCSYTNHYHARKTIKKTRQKMIDVIADIKARYDKATHDKSEYKKKIATTSDAKSLLAKALEKKYAEIKELCNNLLGYCSGFDLSQELLTLIGQLEVESRSLNSVDAKQQAQAFIRSLKQLCDELKRAQTENRNKNRSMKIMDTYIPDENTANPASQTPIAPASSCSSTSANSGSHASTDVVALIQSLKKSKETKLTTRKGNKKQSEHSDSDESREDESVQECSSDISDDDIVANRRQKGRLTAKVRKSKNSKLPDLVKMTTSELVCEYRMTTDERLSNSIVHELKQRSKGKSKHPLDNVQTPLFQELTKTYSAFDARKLREKYAKLEDDISQVMGGDILNIEKVQKRSLLEVRVLFELLEYAEEPSSDQNRTSRSEQRQESMNQHRIEHTCVNCCHDHRQFNPHGPMYSHNSFELCESHHGQNFHGRNPHFSLNMPEYQQTPRMPPQQGVPHHVRHQQSSYPIINQQENEYFSNDEPPPPYSTRQSVHAMHTDSQEEYYQSSRSSSDRPYTCASTVTPRTKKQEEPRKVGVRSENNNAEKSQQAPDTGIYRVWETSRLIDKYKKASSKDSKEDRNMIQQELEQRCYGNYPQLIKMQPILFQQKCRQHQNESSQTLQRNYLAMKQLISARLLNEDVTNIGSVPDEHILEAAALLKLMAIKDGE